MTIHCFFAGLCFTFTHASALGVTCLRYQLRDFSSAEVGRLDILRKPFSVRCAISYHVSAERPSTHFRESVDKIS
jgi:hypothetical protein